MASRRALETLLATDGWELSQKCGRFSKLARDARHWLLVSASIDRDRSGVFSGDAATISYNYEANGDTHYGFARGEVEVRSSPQRVAAFFDNNPILNVRVNPADPLESRLLNQDNPKLPFEVDHLPS